MMVGRFPLSDLAGPVARPVFDVFSAAWVVLLITVWEKPTVQTFIARARLRFNRKDDDATGR